MPDNICPTDPTVGVYVRNPMVPDADSTEERPRGTSPEVRSLPISQLRFRDTVFGVDLATNELAIQYKPEGTITNPLVKKLLSFAPFLITATGWAGVPARGLIEGFVKMATTKAPDAINPQALVSRPDDKGKCGLYLNPDYVGFPELVKMDDDKVAVIKKYLYNNVMSFAPEMKDILKDPAVKASFSKDSNAMLDKASTNGILDKLPGGCFMTPEFLSKMTPDMWKKIPTEFRLALAKQNTGIFASEKKDKSIYTMPAEALALFPAESYLDMSPDMYKKLDPKFIVDRPNLSQRFMSKEDYDKLVKQYNDANPEPAAKPSADQAKDKPVVKAATPSGKHLPSKTLPTKK